MQLFDSFIDLLVWVSCICLGLLPLNVFVYVYLKTTEHEKKEWNWNPPFFLDCSFSSIFFLVSHIFSSKKRNFHREFGKLRWDEKWFFFRQTSFSNWTILRWSTKQLCTTIFQMHKILFYNVAWRYSMPMQAKEFWNLKLLMFKKNYIWLHID